MRYLVYTVRYTVVSCGPGSSVGIATELRAGRSGIECRWERDFPPVQTGPGAHPVSCTMGTGSFPEVKCGRGELRTTHPFLVPRDPVTGLLHRACNGITLLYSAVSPIIETLYYSEQPVYNDTEHTTPFMTLWPSSTVYGEKPVHFNNYTPKHSGPFWEIVKEIQVIPKHNCIKTIFFCGAAAQRGPWAPHSWGF